MILNPVYKPAWSSEHRYLHLYGGAGAGKSYFAAQKIILRCLQEKGHRFLALRKVAKTLRHSVFQLIRDILQDEGLTEVVRINKSEMSFHFPNGSEIISAGLDDPEKLKSISGITGIWIEEPTEIKDTDEFTQVDLRMRGESKYYKQILLTYNPIDPLHWLKRDFHDTDRQDTLMLRTTYQDNPYIGKEYESVLEGMEENMRAIYMMGEWGYANAPNQLIKIEWVVRAKKVEPSDGIQRAGIDVARYGDDKTVFGRFSGNSFIDIKEFGNQSITETARQAFMYIQDHNIRPENVGVDVVGMGAGVVDWLRDKNQSVKEIVSGGSPVSSYEHDFYKFKNLRTQMWWATREALRNDNIALKVDSQKLLEDLTSVKYEVNDKNIEVFSKEKIKKELGRSTDYGDAFVYGWFVDKLQGEPWVMWG